MLFLGGDLVGDVMEEHKCPFEIVLQLEMLATGSQPHRGFIAAGQFLSDAR